MRVLGGETRGQGMPDLEEVKARGRLVKSDARYTVYDYVLHGTTYSVTELKPHQETRGHHHDAIEEHYFFKRGRGRFTVGERTFEVDAALMSPSQLTFEVAMGEFHKVVNTSSGPLIFLATFAGSRDESKAVYSNLGSEMGAAAGVSHSNALRPKARAGGAK